YNDLLSDTELFENARRYYSENDWMERNMRTQFESTLKELRDDALASALRDLLKPRDTKDGPALDLVLLAQKRDLRKASLGSLLDRALRLKKPPEVQAEVEGRLAELRKQYPRDVTVALATAFAAAEGKPEAFAQAVTSLLAAVEVNPLEELP